MYLIFDKNRNSYFYNCDCDCILGVNYKSFDFCKDIEYAKIFNSEKSVAKCLQCLRTHLYNVSCIIY